MADNILLIKQEQGWTVVVDEGFGGYAPHLCPDEALGVLAAILFEGKRPVWLRTPEGIEAIAAKRTKREVDPASPDALDWNREREADAHG